MVDGGEVLVASWYFVIYFLPTNNKFQAVHQYSNILLGLLGPIDPPDSWHRPTIFREKLMDGTPGTWR